jgi:hypothetical protein
VTAVTGFVLNALLADGSHIHCQEGYVITGMETRARFVLQRDGSAAFHQVDGVRTFTENKGKNHETRETHEGELWKQGMPYGSRECRKRRVPLKISFMVPSRVISTLSSGSS